ncbi:hypothetical protein ACFX2I_011218 [Malus domestica]
MEDDEEAPPLAIEIDQPLGPYSQQQPNSSSHKDDDVLVGVTVITGYLGAGKSTLVNHILNSQHGKKIAVILNDFGEEIGLERAMINKGDGGALVEEWVELAKGGIFCTVKHSLVQALEQLVPKRKLDRILLETTGLANLAPLASVVDAKNLRYQLSEHRISSSFAEAYLQIAFAVRLWIEEILWEKKHDMDVYRCKGVLSVYNSNQFHTLQGVSFCSSPHSNRVIQEFAYLHFSGLERIQRRIPCLIGLEVRYPR